MAVQQNHTSRSKRGMRRSHDALTAASLAVDSSSKEVHLRHNVTADGYYRGKKVIVKKDPNEIPEAAEEKNEE